VAQGLESTIHSFDGCFVARFDPSSLSGSISLNAWGAAVEVNADTNRTGSPPVQDPGLVGVMKAWGFGWGGDLIIPDGKHFGYLSKPVRT
jgi:hypothetical protein